MTTKASFFALRGPLDLLKKLEHDFERLRGNPLDTYAAFDFFVTATHMHEWVEKHHWPSPVRNEREEAVFRLSGALGNGAKHFSVPQRLQGGRTAVRAGAFQPGAFQPGAFQADAFDVGDLEVHLAPAEAAIFGSPLPVRTLSREALDMWQSYFAAHRR